MGKIGETYFVTEVMSDSGELHLVRTRSYPTHQKIIDSIDFDLTIRANRKLEKIVGLSLKYTKKRSNKYILVKKIEDLGEGLFIYRDGDLYKVVIESVGKDEHYYEAYKMDEE